MLSINWKKKKDCGKSRLQALARMEGGGSYLLFISPILLNIMIIWTWAFAVIFVGEKSRQKATTWKKVLYFIVELFIEDTQYLSLCCGRYISLRR